jgi:predicted PurR-regulated permease PerM
MAEVKGDGPGPTLLGVTHVDLIIRLGLLGLVGYWSLKVIAPFLTIVLWSAILTVALYPVFDWLARLTRRRRLAAALITSLCLLIVVGPVTWLGFGLAGGVGSLMQQLDAGLFSVPQPPATIKDWPLIGEHVHRLWTLAATNIGAMLVQIAPHLKPIAAKLLSIAEDIGLGLLEFVASIIVAGFLFCPGPRIVDALRALSRRVLSDRGEDMVQLAGATVRNVSRGVVGIALLQSILAGVGFLAAGVPAAGVFAFLALLLAIAQVGPGILLIPIVIWSWTTMETVHALIFTLYMVVVGVMDNILRPILMARGLTTPMLVIVLGVVGGIIAYGIIGLFVGPIVLSVAWELFKAWMQESEAAGEKSHTEA